MIRFKDFLRESEDEDLEEFIEVLKKCQKNLELVASKKQLPAWRGDESEHHLVILPSGTGVKYLERDARTSLRKSAADANAALVYATNNWKGFPRRGYSNFGTLNRRHADETFNSACWMVPFDNVTNFASAELDFNIWADLPEKRAAHQLMSTLAGLGRHLKRAPVQRNPAHNKNGPVYELVFALANKHGLRVFSDSHENALGDALSSADTQDKAIEFLQALMELQPKLSEIANKLELPPTGQSGTPPNDRLTINRDKGLAEWIEDYMGQVRTATKGDIAGHLKRAFSPETFGVELIKGYANLPHHLKTFSEFWFEGGYLSIDGYDPDMLTNSNVPYLAKQMLELLKVKA